MNVKERVDVLLEVGTVEPKKWMAVPGYKDPDLAEIARSPMGSWQRLKDHHVAETTFLFEVIEELRRRLVE